MSSLVRCLNVIRSTSLFARFVSNPYFSHHDASTSSQPSSRKHLSLDYNDDVAIIRLDQKGSKVNTLNTEVLSEFETIFDDIQKDKNVSSVVMISSKPGCFVAGADINMLKSAGDEQRVIEISKKGQDVTQKLENSTKPFVAAIHGIALGGGLELSLACQYRIATTDKKTNLGVPEVMLGLLPGAGGTQRLPKHVGVSNALDMAMTGKNIKPKKAKQMGLVHQLVEPIGPGLTDPETGTMKYLEQIAVNVAHSLGNGTMKVPKAKQTTSDKIMNLALSNEYICNYFFNYVKNKTLKMTKGLYPAPIQIAEVIKEGIAHGSEAGYNAEAKGFGRLSQTSESKALVSIYDGQTHCKKNRFGNPQRPPKTVAVLGAGLMGAGIAKVSLDKGYHTILKDTFPNGLSKGQEQIYKGFDAAAKKKKITTFERDAIVARLEPTLSYEALRNADIVIEAVFEDINLKHKVVKETEAVVPEHCIFASNTSTLPITEIAKASKRPDKVIGMHYFSPVDKMQLLEIITTDQTSKETTAAAVQIGLKQGKQVIVVKDGPGFYTSRFLISGLTELVRILQEGHDPRKINKIITSLGFPVGFVTLLDEIGLDVILHVLTYLQDVFGERLSGGNVAMLQHLIDNGFSGRKSGKGFFVYSASDKDRPINEEATKILKEFPLRPDPSVGSDSDIYLRMISRVVNEAVLCLQEGVLDNPLEGEIGAVFGCGFPPCLGGPFRYIDTYGADQLVSHMRRFEKAYGSCFKPCALLLDHANDSSKKFHTH